MNFEKFELKRVDFTPQTLFFALNKSKHAVLLESGGRHPKTSRYSFLGISPVQIFEAKGEACKLTSKGKTKQWKGNPLTFLKEELSRFPSIQNDLNEPPLVGGAIGFFSYEAFQWCEPIKARNKAALNLPDLYFLFFDWIIAFDHAENKITILGKEEARAEIKRAAEGISHLKPEPQQENSPLELDQDLNRWQASFSKEEFCRAVLKAKEYIRAGDIFQANLSQQLFTNTQASGEGLYRAIQKINPSPFSAYLKTPQFEIISCSPERLVSLNQDLAETRPIAGTRPRAPNREQDARLEHELQQNIKERAEHIMLLDLERNDLGKVCEYGTIEVSEFLEIEKYSHVRHLVSNVQGKLRMECTSLDLLKALFPGGTITGTPKVRAMEIIDELEPVKREIYTGSLGYFSYTGCSDFNILIRTFIKQGEKLYLNVGAGIVADSLPEKEYEETWHKAYALTQALNLAEHTEKQQNLAPLA